MPWKGTRMSAVRVALIAAVLMAGSVIVASPANAAPPTVTLTAPANGATVSGTVTMDVTASSNTDKVEYYIGDVLVATDATANGSWSEPWDTLTVADGQHWVTAVAYNLDDNTATVSNANQVTVDNIPDTTPAPPLPDLRAESVGAAGGDYKLADVQEGESLQLAGNWHIDAAATDKPERITWYIDGAQVATVLYGAAPPGAYGAYGEPNWTATAGAHVLKMVLDPANEIAEANETNNEATRSFTVAGSTTTPPPDDTPPTIPASGPIPAADETQAFASGTGDLADDPAIYVDPTDPTRSVVIGSKKASSGGGLGVYNLAGDQIQFHAAGELNNVDIRTVGGKVVVLTTERGANTLKFFFYNPTTRTLSNAGSFPTGFEPYGGCLYLNSAGTLYGFVTRRNSPFDFDQYQLTVGATAVTGAKVRDLTTSSLSESCVADDEGGHVFLSQETSGVYRYAAAANGGSTRTTVAAVGSNGVTADVEGLAIARGRGATHPDHLIVSSQGANTYQAFDLAAPHTFRKSFTVTAATNGSGADAVTGTDGLEVTRADLGAQYPNGLLVVHDTANAGGTVSNFKFVDAGAVLGAYATTPTPDPTPDPTPTPAPTDRGPSGSVVVWEDDFENGMNCSIWTRMQNNDTGPNGSYASSLCTDLPSSGTPRGSFPEDGGDQGPGDRAFRSEVRSGDLSANGERSELSSSGPDWRFTEGYEGWLQQRIKVDPSMVQEQNDRFYILTQWHAGSGSPPLVLGLEDDGALTVESNGLGTVPKTTVLTAAEFPKGTWFDVNLHFVMSTSSATGGVEVFVDGVRKTPWLAGATMADGSNYLKIGQYRDPQPATGVVYVDDVRLTRP